MKIYEIYENEKEIERLKERIEDLEEKNEDLIYEKSELEETVHELTIRLELINDFAKDIIEETDI